MSTIHSTPAQALRVHVSQLIQTLDYFGRPLSDANSGDLSNAGALVDAVDAVHPCQGQRVAPDFRFHPQAYRPNDEIIPLLMTR